MSTFEFVAGFQRFESPEAQLKTKSDYSHPVPKQSHCESIASLKQGS
jgi:hypothetical protein